MSKKSLAFMRPEKNRRKFGFLDIAPGDQLVLCYWDQKIAEIHVTDGVLQEIENFFCKLSEEENLAE